jgi:cellulose synthase/poly-beta-1,6-N-acetylglucosamine synthase-like glycosyltransferase
MVVPVILVLLAWCALVPLALVASLPALTDAWCWFRAHRARRRQPPLPVPVLPRFAFVVPAHDEELLIARCVRSLQAIEYPEGSSEIIVIADNCQDDTARIAQECGASVLERTSTDERGKSAAIGWALRQLDLPAFDAIILIDADTIVEPDYATCLARWAPLRGKALQSYDGMSNEFENWLTRMAGMLTRNRYGITLELKEAGGLNTPLTGDGTVLGTELLAAHPWQISTVTEGWEIYARLTLAGIQTIYVPEARLYAQETRSLKQSRSQRERWTSGRLAVLRMYWKAIVRARHLELAQRLDLVAELTNTGPVMRAFTGTVGVALGVLLGSPASLAVAALGAAGVLQPALYSLISLTRHPQPWPTILAFLRFPVYAGWRVAVGIGALAISGRALFVRTGRHLESEPGPSSPPPRTSREG